MALVHVATGLLASFISLLRKIVIAFEAPKIIKQVVHYCWRSQLTHALHVINTSS